MGQDNSVHTTRQPLFIAIGGMVGSGKTTLAEALLPHLPNAHLIDADMERKRLHGVAPTAKLPEDAYSHENTLLFITHMLGVQQQALLHHDLVISTGTWLSPRARENIQSEICAETKAEFIGLWLDASYMTLFNRISHRAQGPSVSDADVGVLKKLASRPVNAPEADASWRILDGEKSIPDLVEDALATIAAMRRTDAPHANAGRRFKS